MIMKRPSARLAEMGVGGEGTGEWFVWVEARQRIDEGNDSRGPELGLIDEACFMNTKSRGY